MRTLLVTNDFPPRPGGIQAYLHALALRQPVGELVVYSSTHPGAAAFDAAQPFPVVRDRTSVLLPTPRVRRAVRDVARAEGCDRVWFGATTPLGLLADAFDGARAVGCSQGHELGWGRLPVARQVLQRIGRQLDVVTCLSRFTRDRLAPLLPGTELVQLPSGVDTEVFHPGAGGEQVRAQHGLGTRPVVVCVSRLVPRKGQELLVRAMPSVRERVPDAALLLVGGGPRLEALRSLVADLGLEGDVVLTGEVPWAALPAHYDAGDVFAMPCRDRFGGIEVEGLGIVFLEAAATGLPVIAGRSGGSVDTVLEGETGHLVDGSDQAQVTERLVELLSDPDRAAAMGRAGREWMQRDWQWDALAARLRSVLAGP